MESAFRITIDDRGDRPALFVEPIPPLIPYKSIHYSSTRSFPLPSPLPSGPHHRSLLNPLTVIGMEPADHDQASSKMTGRKGYKSSFSIDSLLEKKLGNPTDLPQNSESDSPAPNRFQTAPTNRMANFDHVRMSFVPALSPHLALTRWPFLHGPLQQHHPTLAAVAPIWALAAQAAAASGIPIPPFPPNPTGMPMAGTSTDRRPAGITKPAPVKKYKCDVCSKAFSRSNTLVTHKRIHSGEKPFSCEHCGRAFRQPGNLTRHRLTHTTVKPYVCTQCGKAFNRASNLHTHMRTHTDYRPHVCPFCAKAFHQKIDMKIHSYTHTGEKPFRCGTCHKGFTLSSTLNAHQKTHCGEGQSAGQSGYPHSCDQCGKGFLQRSSLKNHILASHPSNRVL